MSKKLAKSTLRRRNEIGKSKSMTPIEPIPVENPIEKRAKTQREPASDARPCPGAALTDRSK